MRLFTRFFVFVFSALLVVSSCVPVSVSLDTSPYTTTHLIAVQSSAPINPATASGLWMDSSVPDALSAVAQAWNLPAATDPSSAAVSIHIAQFMPGATDRTAWVYALVAPFPTVTDGVSSYDLRSAWAGTSTGVFGGRPLLMEESTLAAFTVLWGPPASGSVKTVSANQLLDTAWSEMPSWAIVPFESLQPRWKVLTIDGQSPIHKDFDITQYPLVAGFQVRAANTTSYMLPATNRDPNKMTTIIMTGVTALVRATARIMEIKGVTYPGQDIRDWMREADIAHVSNEIPFFTGCGYPNPSQIALVFCSNPKYIDLLTDIGTDVVELTGNHFGDYGEAAMMETLALYKEKGIPYFGGGANLEDARKPLTLVDHGNKIAFVGCNPVDVGDFEVATDTRAGANPCNMQYQADQIKQLKQQGYVVISTFQYYEYYSPEARPWQQRDFRLMADSGASIVSGSQAHFAQVMEFDGNSFIHYGLGNLFFDQMGDIPPEPGIRREFLDRHVVYDGKYISTELLTAMLEDYSRPRPMTPEERAAFLQEYFEDSGWLPKSPTPTPAPTMTLTPMVLPTLSATSTGSALQTPTPTP